MQLISIELKIYDRTCPPRQLNNKHYIATPEITSACYTISKINMTPKFETFSENSVIQLMTEKQIAFVSSKMFNPLDFIEKLKKSSGNNIYQWISKAFECTLLAPNQNWRKGTITLELLFYPGEVALLGNDTIISLSEYYANGNTKEVTFFSPDKFANVIKTTQGEEAYKLMNNKFECRILVPGKEWQIGEIGLFLIFYPDLDKLNISDEQTALVSSPLDEIRKIITHTSPLDEIRQLSNELTSMTSLAEPPRKRIEQN
jgi:hypothetical protein